MNSVTENLESGLRSTGPQFIQQSFFFASGNINVRAVAHDKIATFALYVPVNFQEVDQVGIVYPEKRVFFEYFFYFFEGPWNSYFFLFFSMKTV